jgi:hypothetical protein
VTGIVAAVQVTFPAPPAAGVVHAHPDGALTEAKVVFAGSVSLTMTLGAGSSMLFDTIME